MKKFHLHTEKADPPPQWALLGTISTQASHKMHYFLEKDFQLSIKVLDPVEVNDAVFNQTLCSGEDYAFITVQNKNEQQRLFLQQPHVDFWLLVQQKHKGALQAIFQNALMKQGIIQSTFEAVIKPATLKILQHFDTTKLQ